MWTLHVLTDLFSTRVSFLSVAQRTVGGAGVTVWPKCDDCGDAICSNCRTWCCGELFCEWCGDYHATHFCVRKPLQSNANARSSPDKARTDLINARLPKWSKLHRLMCVKKSTMPYAT